MLSSPGKTRITILVDDDVLEHFRSQAEAASVGYQTMINAALRDSIAKPQPRASADRPLTAATLRKILREELQAA